MQFMLCHNNTTQIGGKELIPQWQAKPGSWIWLDLHAEPVDEEQTFLHIQFSLDEGAISEAQRDRHPPSFEVFKDYIYLLLKPLDAVSNSLDFNTLQLAMFAGEHFLVTRHSKVSPYLEKLWQTLEKNGCADETPMSLVAAMSRRVAQRYGQVLLDLEQRLDVIEDELFVSPTDTSPGHRHPKAHRPSNLAAGRAGSLSCHCWHYTSYAALRRSSWRLLIRVTSAA